MNVNRRESKNCRASGPLAAVLDRCHAEPVEASLPSIRWVSAPQASLLGAPAVQGVALAPGEDVQWLWTHTPNGSYVSGYNIVRTRALKPVILSEAKNLSRTGRTAKRQRPFARLRVTSTKEFLHAN